MRKEHTTLVRGSVIACAVVLSIFAGCVEQLRELQQQEEVTKPYIEEALEVFENNIGTEEISIDFTTKNGYIEVHLWEKESYRIEVNKWARAETAEEAKTMAENLQANLSEQTETLKTTLRLEVEFTKDTGGDIRAYLPEKSFDTVELTSLNGYVTMEEVTASYVALESVNGSIEAYLTSDNIRVKTVNGGIKGFYQGDDVDISTVNGDVDIQAGSEGAFNVSSVNGDIDVVVDSDFSFDLEISHGKISVGADEVVYTLDLKTHKKGSTAEEPHVSLKAVTVNGSITVTKK